MSSKEHNKTQSNQSTGVKSESKIQPTGVKRKSIENSTSSEKGEISKEEKTTTVVTIQLNSNKIKAKKEPILQKKKASIASVFNDDSDSEQEEMPLECRMRMRNIGRDTATSSGPKSFNKGKQGFTNHSFKKFEMSMKPRNSMEKQIDYDGK